MSVKTALEPEAILAQTATELPDRYSTQIIVTITNLLNNNTVTVTVENVDVAAQICAAVASSGRFSCTVTQ